MLNHKTINVINFIFLAIWKNKKDMDFFKNSYVGTQGMRAIEGRYYNKKGENQGIPILVRHIFLSWSQNLIVMIHQSMHDT